MGYRGSRDRIKAAADWAAFIDANRNVIKAAGLPEQVTASIAAWEDFLGQDGARLSEAQYAALWQLVDSYFARGYEYFSPAVLRAGDLQRLDMRYRSGQGVK